jgi:hypothetical protein
MAIAAPSAVKPRALLHGPTTRRGRTKQIIRLPGPCSSSPRSYPS